MTKKENLQEWQFEDDQRQESFINFNSVKEKLLKEQKYDNIYENYLDDL